MTGRKVTYFPFTKKSTIFIISYRPISLFPVFLKVFERIIVNSLFNYFLENKLFTECQPRFLLGDSCISQLLSVTHEIYKFFDCNPSVDVRGTFLDISKAFAKVWHNGLINKLNSHGVENKLLNLIQNYLKNRQQRVLLNGRTSKFLFLIYINDLPDGLKSILKSRFPDDTSLYSKINDIGTIILTSTAI